MTILIYMSHARSQVCLRGGGGLRRVRWTFTKLNSCSIMNGPDRVDLLQLGPVGVIVRPQWRIQGGGG